jgi:dipeptide/tripeptide permease
MSTNLVLYFKNRLHQHSATASKNVSNWSGTCYLTPLIGAFLADAYLGRYRTIACFSIIYVIVSFVHLKLKLGSLCTSLESQHGEVHAEFNTPLWGHLKLGMISASGST